MNRNAKVVKSFGLGRGIPYDLESQVKELVLKEVAKVHPSQDRDLASGANQMQRAVTSPTFGAPSQSQKFVQKNRNLEPGSKTISEIAGAPSYSEMDTAEKVAARAACARFCKQQGRTSCPVCQGAGWDHVSKTEPSRNAKAHSSRNVVAKSNGSEFRRV